MQINLTTTRNCKSGNGVGDTDVCSLCSLGKLICEATMLLRMATDFLMVQEDYSRPRFCKKEYMLYYKYIVYIIFFNKTLFPYPQKADFAALFKPQNSP
jgi:hypothetical protein